MDRNGFNKKMEKYNIIIHKNKCKYEAEKWANLTSSVLFLISLIPFLAKLVVLSGGIGARMIQTEKLQSVILKIANLLPYLSADLETWKFIQYSCIYLFFIPVLAGLIVYIIVRLVFFKSKPEPLCEAVEKNADKLIYEFFFRGETPNILPLDFDYEIFNPFVIFISIVSVSLMSLIFSIWDIIVLCGENASSNDLAVILYGILKTIGFFISLGIPTMIIATIFLGILKITVLANYRRIHIYYKAKDEYETLLSKLKEELQAEADTKAIYEKEQKALHAENFFKTLTLDGNEDVSQIRNLAEEGSMSACLYMGKKLYQQHMDEALTKNEKKELAQRIIKYLEYPSNHGNMEAKILSLSIRFKSESNTLKTWENYLNTAREYKNSDNLPQEYTELVDNMISDLIYTIDNFGQNSSTNTSDDSFNYDLYQRGINNYMKKMYGSDTFEKDSDCWECGSTGSAANGGMPVLGTYSKDM